MEAEYGTKVAMEFNNYVDKVCNEYLDTMRNRIDSLAIDTIRKYIKEPPKEITKDWLISNNIVEIKISSPRMFYGTEGVESLCMTQEFLGIVVKSDSTLEEHIKLQGKTKKVLSNKDLITPKGYRIPLDDDGNELFEFIQKIEEIE